MITTTKLRPIEYLSYGAGPPSAALLVANLHGLVTPRAELVLFADTRVGETEYLGENEETYRSVDFYREYAAEFDAELVTVGSKDGALERYVRERSLPIPVFSPTGMGHRQCTDQWKIAPVEQELHRRFGNVPLIAQLGLAKDMRDVVRMRQPRVKRNRNRWPLIELGWNRADCIAYLESLGLPVPPPSSCEFCPLQSTSRFHDLITSRPKTFERVADLDEMIRERQKAEGKEPRWIHYSKQPLRQKFAGKIGQRVLPLFSADEEEVEAGCDAGVCGT